MSDDDMPKMEREWGVKTSIFGGCLSLGILAFCIVLLAGVIYQTIKVILE